MKRITITVLILSILLFSLVGCNRQIIDVTYNYNKAIIELQNGEVIEGKVDSWSDYEDGDQIQIKIDGVTYLVHSSNVTLINE